MHYRRLIFAGLSSLLPAAVVPSSGCSKSNVVNQDNSTTNNTINNVTQVVGPEGATVDGPDGSQLVVPPGALSEEIELTIGELPDESLETPIPDGNIPVSTTFAFLPHGQLFALDARISFNHTASDPEAVRLLRSEPGGDWQEVTVTDVSESRVIRGTATFSYYVAVVDESDSSGGAGGAGTGGTGGTSGTGGSGLGGSSFDGGSCIPLDGPCAGATDTNCCAPNSCQFQVSEFLCTGP